MCKTSKKTVICSLGNSYNTQNKFGKMAEELSKMFIKIQNSNFNELFFIITENEMGHMMNITYLSYDKFLFNSVELTKKQIEDEIEHLKKLNITEIKIQGFVTLATNFYGYPEFFSIKVL